jgi:hypothetical protein
MTLIRARKFRKSCEYSSLRQYLVHSGDHTSLIRLFFAYSEDPAREQLIHDPSRNPAHAIPPIRNLSPPRPLSPLRYTPPSRPLSPLRDTPPSRPLSPLRDTPPSRPLSPLRDTPPSRPLSPLRYTAPPTPPRRVPARLHIPTSSGAIVPPIPVPPLPADASHRYRSAPRKVKVRQGFWNRHGDCATPDGRYFIRAPPEHQNPPELAHLHQYHFSSYDGRTIAWDRRMKEYPDSLSKHGQPARYPYEYVRASFIIAGYFSNTLLQFFKYIEVNESDLRTPEFPSP